MKREMTSFDLRSIVREMQPLVGGYLEKTYQEGEEFHLKFHVPGTARREVYHRLGRWLALTEEAEEKPATPGPFAAALRRTLPNPRLVAVEQRGFDRVAALELHQGEETFQLIFELFGRGNLILTRGGRILHCIRPQVFRSRDLRPGATYMPPEAGINPLSLDVTALGRHLGETKKPVVKALATDLNLGGLYAEEICLRAGVDKGARASTLGERDRGALFAMLHEVVAEADRGPAVLVFEGERPVDALPAALRLYATAEARSFSSLSQALIAYIKAVGQQAPEESEDIARLKRRLAQQDEVHRQLEREVMEAGEAGDYLYAHYAEVEGVLAAAREGRGTPGLLSVDRAAGTLVVRGEGDRPITLALDKDVRANADAYYEARKEARTKAGRVRTALEATQAEVRAIGRREAKVAKTGVRAKPTKRFWFEAYRWFISSDGFLCLGGRDAPSNDKLVKRHLKDGDRYAHADVQGAPSIVIKEGSKAPEITLKEACHFSLLHSKAWAAGLAAGSAYWVLPEQVSKRAETGEYLRPGGFVIRGRRNYFHDLTLEIAIGEVSYEGHRKVMGGPVTTITHRSPRFALLAPGRGSREAAVHELASAFDVPLEEINRVIPPGRSEIREWSGAESPGAASEAAKG